MAGKKKAEEKAVVSWEDRMAQEAKEVAKTERAPISKIGLKGGVMTYMGQAVPENELTGIILCAVKENVYYDKDYDPDVIHDPACFALALGDDPLVPHANVPSPINATCKGCPNAEFKSAKNKRGKACSERRRLAFIPVVEDPADIAEAEMAVISLPVMSVRNWSVYVNDVATQHNRPSWGVITTVKVVPDSKSQFRVTFGFGAKLGEDFLTAIDARLESVTNQLMAPYEMSGGGSLAGREEEEEGDTKY